MTGPTTVRKIRRVRAHAHEGGRTLYFMTLNGSKRNPTRFFDPDQVPEFEGEEAWFEVEPVRGPVWMTWRFLRQVDEAGKPIALVDASGIRPAASSAT